MTNEQLLNSFQWIVRGNMVVPTGNPFTASADADNPSNGSYDNTHDESESSVQVVWLGPCLKLLIDHILTVDHEGIIQHLEPANDFLQRYSLSHLELDNFLELHDRHDFLCPGFCDLHIHAPQFAYAGTATDRPLLGPQGWLETYTFPAESRLKDDVDLARHVYDSVVQTTLHHGTTTAVYFATLHVEPCKVLVDVAQQRGQRALIGKVCMDRHAPDHYLQSVQQNVDETEELIAYIHAKAGRLRHRSQGEAEDSKTTPTSGVLPLLLPLVTPRFIPTCTPQLMTALGKLAAKYDCHVTTHISESIDEVQFSRSLDIQDQKAEHIDNVILERTDADILDAHGLLTDRCILAHGVHLTDADCTVLQRCGSAICHCPLSNVYFAGGILPCRTMLEKKVKVGLGTDIAGGYNPSMLHSARMAVVASHMLQQQHENENNTARTRLVRSSIERAVDVTRDNNDVSDDETGSAIRLTIPPTDPKAEFASHPESHPDHEPNETKHSHVLGYRHAFYLATLGGAEALGLQTSIGTLAVGMEFDSVVLSSNSWAPNDCSSSNVPFSITSPVQVFDSDTMADIFQKICVLGDDRNVTQVFVQGRRVKTT